MGLGFLSQFSTDTVELFQAILAQAPDKATAAALLVGSYGESGWNPYAAGSGGAGAFGFTPPSYPLSLGSEPPSAQVRAILPAYLNIPFPIPDSVTNPAARAEWQAIAAERPEYDTERLATIEATNAPTYYGANMSYTVQNWNLIQQIISFFSEVDFVQPTFIKAANGNYYDKEFYPVEGTQWREVAANVAAQRIAQGYLPFDDSENIEFPRWGVHTA